MNFSSIKYPRTPHLPFSPAYAADDEMLMDIKEIWGERIVVTEKMDGENVTLYPMHWHSRSINSEKRKHESRDWMASYWSSISHMIPDGYRICGENLYAKHSIAYENLPSFFLGFSAWDEENVCLSWDATVELFAKIGIVSVPVLYQGPWDFGVLSNIAASLNLVTQEGFVIRLERKFPFSEFLSSVGKWVRKGHIQEEERHWFKSKVIKNGLKKGGVNGETE